jgi:hypothetical protein
VATTGSGIIAGPALKLNTSPILSSASFLIIAGVALLRKRSGLRIFYLPATKPLMLLCCLD